MATTMQMKLVLEEESLLSSVIKHIFLHSKYLRFIPPYLWLKGLDRILLDSMERYCLEVSRKIYGDSMLIDVQYLTSIYPFITLPALEVLLKLPQNKVLLTCP